MSHSVESKTLDTKDEATYAVVPAALSAGPKDSVSVVIPCFNEQQFISAVLNNLANQYQPDNYEILVVDGRSTDRTRQVIQEFAKNNAELRIRVVDNPARNIPTALNLGIRAASGEIIVRMDAHSIPSPGYVRRCVQLLSEDKAAVVGMPWHIKPGAETLMARAIALAVSHPFGIGDAKYRLTSSTAQLVDTVPFGAFKKSLWKEVGGFNEHLLTNEDYDFNYRVRKGNGLVLLDNGAHCDYYARPSLGQLAAQYLRYGSWKAQMVKSHPASIKLRHLVAPAFVSYILIALVAGLFWRPALVMLVAVVALYSLLAFIFASKLALRERDLRLAFLIPIVFFVIHSVWGGSFLLGLVISPAGSGKR
jgi:succinoglycan biosynthesis protein ExoA